MQNFVDVLANTTPTTPNSGETRVFADSSTKKLKSVSDDGTVTEYVANSGDIKAKTLSDDAGNLIVSSTNPTIASGFGTSPTITANNTAAFKIVIGTGGTEQSGVITLPTAPNGWVAFATNVTNNATSVVSQSAESTTSVTLQNYSRTTGLAAAFTAGDEIHVSCLAY